MDVDYSVGQSRQQKSQNWKSTGEGRSSGLWDSDSDVSRPTEGRPLSLRPRPGGTYKPRPLRWPFLAAEIILLTTALIVVVGFMWAMPDSDDSAIVYYDWPVTASSSAPLRAHVVEDVSTFAGAAIATTTGSNGGYEELLLRYRRAANSTLDGVELSPTPTPMPTPATPSRTWTGGRPIYTSGAPVPEDCCGGGNPEGHGVKGPKWDPPPKQTPTPAASSNGILNISNSTIERSEGGSFTTDDVVLPKDDYRPEGSTQAPGFSMKAVRPEPSDDPEPATPTPAEPETVFTTATVIVDATAITVVITSNPTPPPAQTSYDESGAPTLWQPEAPPPTLLTITGIVGGHVETQLVLDDGLTGETSTIVATVGGTEVAVVSTPPLQTVVRTVTDDGAAVGGIKAVELVTDILTPPPVTIVSTVGGTPLTILAVSTPGKPVTETFLSVVDGVAVTVTPPPVTFTTDRGDGLGLVTVTSTPHVFVTTTGGWTATQVRTTTPGRVVTTKVPTTMDGTPTEILAVITVTPTASTRHAAPPRAPTTGTTTNTAISPSGTAVGGNSTVALSLSSQAHYFAVTFLPTLFAVAVAVPISIIDLNAKLMQPFRTLAAASSDSVVGAAGPDALTLRFGGGFLGCGAVTVPLFLAFHRDQPVPLVTGALVWLSWLLAPLASEAVGFKLRGSCNAWNYRGCDMELGVSPAPAIALVAVLAAMVVLLGGLTVLLRRWDTGLYANPWSVVGVASLSLSPGLREPLLHAGEPKNKELSNMFRHGRFRLEVFDAATTSDDIIDLDDNGGPRYEYGIVPVDNAYHSYRDTGKTRLHPSQTYRADDGQRPEERHVPFLTLTYRWRLVFLGTLLGIIALLTYYHLLHEDNAFERFMDSQSFGLKFLFAALGTAISLFWTSFFQSVAVIAPFMRMSSSFCRARSAAQSILVARPTNAYYGAFAALRQRDALLFAAAVAAAMAELFLPVLLSNIPYTLTQTWSSHVACTAASLALLAAMALVLIVSMVCVKWPHMPVDPRTLAGAIYYVAASEGLLRELGGRGLSIREGRARDREVESWNGRYFYTRVRGSGGRTRMAVDAEDGGLVSVRRLKSI